MISDKCFTSEWITEQRSKGLKAKSAAGKAACAAAIVLSGKTDLDIPTMLFNPLRVQDIAQKNLEGNYSSLARLRNANSESFYYWTVVQDLLG